MALNTVTTGNTVLAADINQLVQVLQRSAGQTETGKYVLSGGVYGNNASVAEYCDSLNRTSTPSSISVDTADQAAGGGCTGVGTSFLTANGFQVFETSTTGPNTNGHAAGNYTIQF
jgi:flagellin-like hook-associated protein FlgL